MATEQRLPTASDSCGEPNHRAPAGSIAEPEVPEPHFLSRTAQEHENITSGKTQTPKPTEPTKMPRSPDLPPDVRLRLEDILGSLQKWGKIQEECINEISGILEGSSDGSAVMRNRLPETTTPELRATTWDAFHRPLDISEVQCTIDVLCEETASSASNSSRLNGAGLPERIRINSARLIYTIKTNFFATNIPQPDPITRPLIILCPFKRLIYYEREMKTLVGGLEAELDTQPQLKWPDGFDGFMEKFEIPKNHGKALNISSYDDLAFYTRELRCLVSFMDKLIEPTRTRLRTETDIVSFSELWFLYPEGTYIFNKATDAAQKVWRIVQRTGGRKEIASKEERLPTYHYTKFVIDCYFVDYNGSGFFPVYGRYEIESFEGKKTVASLPVVPLRIAEKEGLVDQDAIIRRGETFLEYCSKPRHLYYNGWSHHREPNGKRLQRQLDTKIDSGVIVDFKRAVAEDPSLVERETKAAVYSIPDDDPSDENLEFDKDLELDQLLSDKLCGSTRVPDSNGLLLGSRECMPIFPDRVFGYVLRTRKWGA